jgi:predicted RNA-binding protein associated with RNAse of E/G family
MCEITILKLNFQGQETWRYSGEMISEDFEKVILQAYFNREDIAFHGILLKRGDRFVETFFLNRWFNIFEIYDRDDGQKKGWYCNIGYPAKKEDQVLSYVDLALDLLVYPDGSQLILDKDEFDELQLPPEIAKQALSSLDELRQWMDQITQKGSNNPELPQ